MKSALGSDLGSFPPGALLDMVRNSWEEPALVGFVVTIRRLSRSHQMRIALRRLRETSAFQDNTFEGCNSQNLKFMQWETDFAQHPSVTAVPWLWSTQSAG